MNNYTINGLEMSRSVSNIGFFGSIASSAAVSNINFKNIEITQTQLNNNQSRKIQSEQTHYYHSKRKLPKHQYLFQAQNIHGSPDVPVPKVKLVKFAIAGAVQDPRSVPSIAVQKSHVSLELIPGKSFEFELC